MSNNLTTGQTGSNRFLLLVAGRGGLRCGVDGGIIGGARPPLEATFKNAATGRTRNAGQLFFLLAAGLLGRGIAARFAGMPANLPGREKICLLKPIQPQTS